MAAGRHTSAPRPLRSVAGRVARQLDPEIDGLDTERAWALLGRSSDYLAALWVNEGLRRPHWERA